MLKSIFEKKDGTVSLFWAVMIMYFNNKVKPLYHPEQGKDILIIALAFESVRECVTLVKNYLGYIDLLSTGIIAVVFLSLVFLVTQFLHIKLKDIGLRKLLNWNRYEIVYFFLVIPLSFFIFYFFNKQKFAASLTENGWEISVIIFIFFMSWGFYQEWIYRGFLQTELTRRYGATAAILLANVIFTLGPLHFNMMHSGRFVLLAATFLIGLFFGFLYHRSYNLWIIGILHGIGDWYLVGLS